jgi:hypothetical protein
MRRGKFIAHNLSPLLLFVQLSRDKAPTFSHEDVIIWSAYNKETRII